MSQQTNETNVDATAPVVEQVAPDAAAPHAERQGELDDTTIESVAGDHIGEDTSLGHDVGTILAMPIVGAVKLYRWATS